MEREEQAVISGRRLGYYHVDQPPLLIIHGLGAVWERSDPFFRFLSRHLELFVIDLPGYGGSDPLNGAEGLASYAKTLEEFCAAKGLERVYLLGLSFGSLVATAFATSYPKRCEKLILVGAPIFLPRLARLLLGLSACIPLFLVQFQIVRSILRRLVLGVMRIPAIQAARFFRESGAEDFFEGRYVRLDVLRTNVRILAETDLNQLLAKVRPLYLLIYGGKDMFLNQQVQETYSEYLCVIEGATHCPHWTHPKEFAEVVIKFLLG